MTSRRDVFEEGSTDELGRLIQWALRERVAGASPPPRTWENIRALTERPTAWSLMRRGFSRGYRAVRARLSRVGAFLSAQIASWIWPQHEWVEWRQDPYYTRLLDQYGSLLQLAV